LPSGFLGSLDAIFGAHWDHEPQNWSAGLQPGAITCPWCAGPGGARAPRSGSWYKDYPADLRELVCCARTERSIWLVVAQEERPFSLYGVKTPGSLGANTVFTSSKMTVKMRAKKAWGFSCWGRT